MPAHDLSPLAEPGMPSGELAAALRDLVARGEAGSLGRLEAQVRAVGGCSQPIRLAGRTRQVDLTTGEIRTTYDSVGEPDGVTLTRCNNRRAAVCPSCSKLYKGDARQIVGAGLAGSESKNVPASVAEHPAVFLTLTARSFGAVHSRRTHPQHPDRARMCRPRGGEVTCPHGRSRSCTVLHRPDDPRLGEPLCRDCYDYASQVVFNAVASRLFKRTIIALRRRLAHDCGLSERAFRDQVRIVYVRVAEMQARGVVHFHAVIRLDAAGPEGTYDPPPAWITLDQLADAVEYAAAAARLPCPDPHASTRRAVQLLAAGGLGGQADEPPLATHARWGRQVDVRPIRHDGGPITRDQVANYIAKYATKSIAGLDQLDRPIRTRADIDSLILRAHPLRLVRTCWQLGQQPELAELKLGHWAHAYGFGGHRLTKSRAWSTTFTRLRGTRRRHAARGRT